MHCHTHFSRRLNAGAVAVVLCAALVSVGTASAQDRKFYPDDPLVREPDPADASGVVPFPVHLTWDLASSLLVKEGSRQASPAKNVNTVDEAPDSSWFTNRIGTSALSPEDIARGPDTTSGPAGRWTVISGKSEGIRPGFTMRDEAGVVWFVKFDAPGYPEQATGAEVVSTKLFWALGYNVAETHVATIRRQDVAVGPGATITVHGHRRTMTPGDVDRVLAKADRAADGSYRALASKALEGRPVGEFLYYGTRSDDPNDVVPHEDRRELRGMGVFAAWIDRVDAKAGNTLDTLVTIDGRTVVRHHVMDFGSTLGSGGIGPNEPWEGYEYLYAGRPLAARLLAFGWPVEYWRTIPYPVLRGIGRFEGDHFVPELWRSRVPNQAYVRADAADRFWAARKLAAMTDDLIAAAVRTGHYTDPRAVDDLTATLIKRRDAILRAYLPAINPVTVVALDARGVLTFQNAAAAIPGGSVPVQYEARWYAFDNNTQAVTLLGDTAAPEPSLRAPALPSAGAAMVRVDLSLKAAGRPAWAVPATAYFRHQGDAWALVGLERREAAGGSGGAVAQ